MPKIMYIPAERNFVSAVDSPTTLKKLPNTLYTFLEEFENAKRDLGDKLALPVNGVSLEYNKSTRVSWILGSDYRIKLAESSSGFQSFVPLFMVTRYLATSINKEKDPSIKELSFEEQKRIRLQIEKILSYSSITDDVKKTALEILSAQFRNTCFVNIVEEPEQNLFPSAQKEILFKLLEFAHLNEGNRLVVTTHSPYIINFLTIAIKAFTLSEKISRSSNSSQLGQKLALLVPNASRINPDEAIVYELAEDGTITQLPTFEGLPSDNNFLNQMLAMANELFDQILEIEDSCR